MSGIVLSSAVRTNLNTLQATTMLQGKIQEKLSTGKKVNSALDNPTSFFTAAGLNRRANDLSSLLDGMQQGVKTLEAADNAMKAITKNIETMQANIKSARGDKSFKATNFTIDAAATGSVQFSGGSVGTTPVSVATTNASAGTNTFTYATSAVAFGAPDTATFTLAVDGAAAQTVTINNARVTAVGDMDNVIDDIDEATAVFQAAIDASAVGPGKVTVTNDGTDITFTSETTGLTSGVVIAAATPDADAGGNVTTLQGLANGAGTAGAATGGTVKTVDEMVAAINATTALEGKIKATNDAGKLRIENLSTEALTIQGATSAGVVNGGAGAANATTIGGNDVRKGLINQFNDLRTQLDKLASDASYNGVNLVKADKLKINFNETGTSSIEIQAKDVRTQTVRGISTESNSLNIGVADADEFSDDAALDARLDELSTALTTVQTQSGEFGAALNTVQNRQEFTKSMVNTLQTGADSLTLADANEEAAKLLSLNTRQQLSQTALSLASQADQAVLRLF
jgi:flagellin-like hook-associated protein FlgL